MNKYLLRPLFLYRRVAFFNRYLDDCRKNNTVPRLHVGCGDRPIPGWCNVDVANLGSEVHYLNATKPFPFPNESFQYVFSEHFIEHLPYEGSLAFFREAWRVLRRGGVMRTATPDLDFLCELRHPSTEGQRRYIQYIGENFAADRPRSYVTCANLAFHGWGHRFIWNAKYLQEILAPVGFGDFRVQKPGRSGISDLRDIEQHGKSVPAEINDLETFVLEATKL